jgi:hypothetical protein
LQLINPDPLQNLTAINMLLKRQAARDAYAGRFGLAGAAMGGAVGARALRKE